MIRKTIKRSFTLLELIISISIITICSSVIGIKTYKVLYKHKFENNIKKFNHYIEFCKKMALSNQADVYFNIVQKNETILIEIGTSESQGFFKNVKKTSDILENINIFVNGEKIDSLEIVFTSNGSIFPKDYEIELKDRDIKLESYKIPRI